MKILLIDDDREDCDIFRDAINSIDPSTEFDFAMSCDEALFNLKTQKPPDLIFLDINMPLKSGKECLKTIKTNPLLRAIPLIVYSTSSDQTDVKECMALGASEYMVKPAEFGVLCNALRPWLGPPIK